MSVHHDILGIPEGSSPKEINRAYKRLARKAHPDLGGSETDMKRLNDARDALLSGNTSNPIFDAPKPSHAGSQFNGFFTREPTVDTPFVNGGFDETRAPRDDLGGYSYRQHKREERLERESLEEMEQKTLQTRQALKTGWTPEKAAKTKCAWCNQSMENTQPHESLNKVTTDTGKPLIGIHDVDCLLDARQNSPDHCESCGGILAANEKTANEKKYIGAHAECIDIGFDEMFGKR